LGTVSQEMKRLLGGWNCRKPGETGLWGFQCSSKKATKGGHSAPRGHPWEARSIGSLLKSPDFSWRKKKTFSREPGKVGRQGGEGNPWGKRERQSKVESIFIESENVVSDRNNISAGYLNPTKKQRPIQQGYFGWGIDFGVGRKTERGGGMLFAGKKRKII